MDKLVNIVSDKDEAHITLPLDMKDNFSKSTVIFDSSCYSHESIPLPFDHKSVKTYSCPYR